MIRLSSMVCVVLALIAAAPAMAQIKPATSGAVSYGEPEMRKHGSGLYHPRAAHHRTPARSAPRE